VNSFSWLYDFFNQPQKQDEERKEMLPALAMAQQVLSLVSVIQDLVGSDKNSATSNEVEEIIKAKIDDPIDKLSTEVLDQINESVGADATHKFNSFIDLVKGK
jgi:hypothetical protein|tara:strand:- start:412 stop:720 length:309 start_codon:yes stop_codon:yes gene_type:complete